MSDCGDDLSVVLVDVCQCLQGKGEIETWWLLGEDHPDFPDLAASSSPTL